MKAEQSRVLQYKTSKQPSGLDCQKLQIVVGVPGSNPGKDGKLSAQWIDYNTHNKKQLQFSFYHLFSLKLLNTSQTRLVFVRLRWPYNPHKVETLNQISHEAIYECSQGEKLKFTISHLGKISFLIRQNSYFIFNPVELPCVVTLLGLSEELSWGQGVPNSEKI